jgi:hypothetical protein
MLFSPELDPEWTDLERLEAHRHTPLLADLSLYSLLSALCSLLSVLYSLLSALCSLLSAPVLCAKPVEARLEVHICLLSRFCFCRLRSHVQTLALSSSLFLTPTLSH